MREPAKVADLPAIDDRGRIYERIGRRLIPFLLICYIVAMIDRLNIGYAKLQFGRDLGLGEAVFGFATSIFYVGYVLFEVPSNLALQRSGIRRVLPRIMIAWGFVTLAFAASQTATHFYILRFLLGAAEAGFFPGVVLYLTFWFPDRLRGRAVSLFAAALPIAGIIAGPLSGFIMERFSGLYGLRGWQWLFMIEGVPAILLGVTAYFYLSDGPASARWLSAKERSCIAADLAADRQRNGAIGRNRFRDALTEPRLYILAAVYFAYYCSLNAVLVWTPTLLKNAGISDLITIGWTSGGIALFATLCMLALAYSSDRSRERRWHVAGSGFVTAAAFLMLPLARDSIPITVGLLALASAGVFSVLALFWTIPGAYLSGTAAAGGIGLISAVGSFGGAVSPALIGLMRETSGSFYGGLASVACLTAIGMLVLLVMIPARRSSSFSLTVDL